MQQQMSLSEGDGGFILILSSVMRVHQWAGISPFEAKGFIMVKLEWFSALIYFLFNCLRVFFEWLAFLFCMKNVLYIVKDDLILKCISILGIEIYYSEVTQPSLVNWLSFWKCILQLLLVHLPPPEFWSEVNI